MDHEPGHHVPVLVEELMRALEPRDGGVYADCTYGRGGHCRALLERGGPRTRVLALDRDPQAVQHAQALAREDARLIAVRAPFSRLRAVAGEHGLMFDGVLFDLGISSPQIDEPQRGFSLRGDGPLDMRMDPDAGLSAAEWLAAAGEGEIERVLREFGDERFARRIARALVRAREDAPITRTAQLAQIVAGTIPARAQRADPGQHPATRTFQAIRIHLNAELEELDQGLDQALACLRPGGRLAVVSFHSLEDRRVKRFMRALSRPPRPSRHEPLPEREFAARLRTCGKAVRAGSAELVRNPRARSAVLRVAEKLP